jgi:hypothetical protein
MSASRPILSYATPERKWSIPKWLRGVLVFWLASVSTAILEAGVTIFGPPRDYNSYIGSDFSLVIDVVVILFFFTIAAGAILLIAEFLQWLVPQSESRSSYALWIGMGICFGLACTIPHTIDVALSDHAIDSGGNLDAHGWGDTVARVCFFALPLLVPLIAFRFRRSSSSSD